MTRPAYRYNTLAKKDKDERLLQEISSIVFDALSRLKGEETVPGITRGLFVDALSGKGEIRRILASIELGEDSITYATFGEEKISSSLKGAAQNAAIASNHYLRRSGYVEGLKGRKVTWQITDLDVKANNLKTFYDGASMGFPLTMAIISAYLRYPVPSQLAFTGAFDITSAKEGKLVKVGGTLSKCKAALEKGIRFIFLPKGNETDMDLTLQKEAERKGFEISFIDSVGTACGKIFGDPGKKSKRQMVKEVIYDFLGILTLNPKKPFLKDNLHHIWASSLLIICILLIEGLLIYRVASINPPSLRLFFVATIPVSIIIFMALLLCYAIFPVYIEQQRKDSWYHSVVLLGFAFLVSYMLLLQMVQGETPDLSRFVDWPAPLGILKDLFVIFLFVVLYFTNLFNYVGTLDFLSRRYQITTVQTYLKMPYSLGTGIPVRLIAFSWKWALYGILFAGSVLLIFEMITYWTLKEGVASAKWYITLGIVRDFLLIILAAEVLIWYRNALITIKRRIHE